VLEQVGDRRRRLVELLRAHGDLEQLALAAHVAQFPLAPPRAHELLGVLGLDAGADLKRVVLAEQKAAIGIVLDAVKALQVGDEAEPHLRLDRVHRGRLAGGLRHDALDRCGQRGVELEAALAGGAAQRAPVAQVQREVVERLAVEPLQLAQKAALGERELRERGGVTAQPPAA
jgi:hypothetical protein